MSNPVKPVVRVTPEQEQAIRDAVHRHLVHATNRACAETSISGMVFVLVGVSTFLEELSEVNATAAVDYFRALADMYDDTLSKDVRSEADARRSTAVAAIFANLDLYMAGAQGNA